MRQRDAATRGRDTAGLPGPRPIPDGPAAGERDRLPPGQHLQASMPVLHYGPVPKCNPANWDLRVTGATAAGTEHSWDLAGFGSLPRREIVADFHCVTKFTILGIPWSGGPAADLLADVPPAAAATHVMVWANYGYGA